MAYASDRRWYAAPALAGSQRSTAAALMDSPDLTKRARRDAFARVLVAAGTLAFVVGSILQFCNGLPLYGDSGKAYS